MNLSLDLARDPVQPNLDDHRRGKRVFLTALIAGDSSSAEIAVPLVVGEAPEQTALLVAGRIRSRRRAVGGASRWPAQRPAIGSA